MADKVLILRTCNSDMTSYEGFVWPESGPVVAPDWRDDDECGHGLHGLLWGEGYSHHLLPFADAKWLVVEVERSSVRDLGGKCKFPCGEVSLCGSREEAVNYIQRAAPDAAVCFGTATAGYRGTAIVGDDGTATAGDDGTATAGSYGTATAGDWGPQPLAIVEPQPLATMEPQSPTTSEPQPLVIGEPQLLAMMEPQPLVIGGPQPLTTEALQPLVIGESQELASTVL